MGGVVGVQGVGVGVQGGGVGVQGGGVGVQGGGGGGGGVLQGGVVVHGGLVVVQGSGSCGTAIWPYALRKDTAITSVSRGKLSERLNQSNLARVQLRNFENFKLTNSHRGNKSYTLLSLLGVETFPLYN